VAFRRLSQDVVIHNQVAYLLLQIIDMIFSRSFLVLWSSAQSILGSQKKPLFTILYLGNGQPMLSSSLLDTGLSLDDAKNQCGLSLCRQSLDVIFQLKV
jgi:hypothetical protein